MALGLRLHWMGKHTLFRPPFGRAMRWMGGVPVDREATRGVVAQLVEEFERRERFLLGIAPEGTRSRVTRWKTGFYRIAHRAGVPIVPVGLDWGTQAVRLGDPFTPTGDMEADIQQLRAWFAPIVGKRPENHT
jgi:1-acyl-sn-glycerol-3-phosphate acyltransferase